MKLRTYLAPLFQKFREWRSKHKFSFKNGLREFCIVIGFGVFLYGVYLIYQPAMWIIMGIGILKIGLGGKK